MIIDLDKKPLIQLFQFIQQVGSEQKHLAKIKEWVKYNSNRLSVNDNFFSFAVCNADQVKNSENDIVGNKPATHLFAHLYFVQGRHLFCIQTC